LPAAGGSILSFPERGPWGDPGYRGNCSGYVYREIFAALHPRVFTDPMVGGGTSIEVAREMRIEAHGLDLHSGFNVLKQRILDVVGKPSDLVLSHPPYHNIIVYSGNVWGRGPHPDDLSRCASEDEFLDKLTIALKNQRHATRAGGYYGAIIGDVRRGGCHPLEAHGGGSFASVLVSVQRCTRGASDTGLGRDLPGRSGSTVKVLVAAFAGQCRRPSLRSLSALDT
jgi:hypothetical protein